MEREILQWMQAVVNQDDKRMAYINEQRSALRAQGKRFVGWTGGWGDPERENKVYDDETREVLAVLPDTHEALESAWQEEWYSDDGIWSEAHDQFPDPDMPDRYRFLLDDNYDPDLFREYLQG